jgi:hypothetical protein
MLEKDLLMVVDTILMSLQKQALPQAAAGDAIAAFVAGLEPVLKPVIDQQIAALIPGGQP